MRSALGLGEPAWVDTVRKMSEGLAGPQNLRLALGNVGFASDIAAYTGLRKSIAENLRVPRLFGIESPVAALLRMPVMPFDISETLRRYTGEPVWEFFEAMQEAGLVAGRWERQALWYLLSQLGPYELRRLAPLARAEVEAVVLYALEAVVADGELVPALRTRGRAGATSRELPPHPARPHAVAGGGALLRGSERLALSRA